MVDESRERHVVGLDVHAAAHAVGQALGLFKDFLEHEVRIAALLNLPQVDVDGLHVELLRLVQDADDLQLLVAAYDGDIAVLEVDHLVGVLNDGTGVGAEEEFVVADAHHQRALLAGGNNLVGVALVEHRNGIGANHLAERHLHRRQQVDALVFLDILDELDEHLGVGVALELHAFLLQLLLQVGVVLDDAVVDDGQIARLRIMGVRIAARRLAVGSPAGVGNADGAADVLVGAILAEVVNLALRLIDIQLALAVDKRHACRVVATILEPAQSFYQDGEGIFLSDISYYSAHKI